MNEISLRFTASESVQFFQFDSEGNMYMFAPGAGCTGVIKLVQPGDEMIFTGQSVESNSNTGISSNSLMEELELEVNCGHEVGELRKCTFNEPLKTED